MAITFDNIEINSFVVLPDASVTAYLGLAHALRGRTPADPTEQIMIACEDLDARITDIEAVMNAHPQVGQIPAYGLAADLYGGADGLYGCLRARLSALRAFEHPGLDPLVDTDTPAAEIIRENRRNSERAQAIVAQLFDVDDLRAQTEATGMILGLINERALDTDIDDLVGVPIVQSMVVTQQYYRDMIADRLGGDERGVAKMAALRRRLIRAIVQYDVAIFALLNRNKPETLALVLHALEPVTALHERLGGGGIPGSWPLSYAGDHA